MTHGGKERSDKEAKEDEGRVEKGEKEEWRKGRTVHQGRGSKEKKRRVRKRANDTR